MSSRLYYFGFMFQPDRQKLFLDKAFEHFVSLTSWSPRPQDVYSSISLLDCQSPGQFTQVFLSHKDFSFNACCLPTLSLQRRGNGGLLCVFGSQIKLDISVIFQQYNSVLYVYSQRRALGLLFNGSRKCQFSCDLPMERKSKVESSSVFM